MLLQAIVLSLLIPSSLFRHLSGWQVRTFRTPPFTHLRWWLSGAEATVTEKYTPKAKPPSSAQLLLCA
ncbi:MAG: hypothetical protein WCI92_09325, partial [Bacteroidota bacterium]